MRVIMRDAGVGVRAWPWGVWPRAATGHPHRPGTRTATGALYCLQSTHVLVAGRVFQRAGFVYSLLTWVSPELPAEQVSTGVAG